MDKGIILPPHNVIQFGQREYDNWVWWMGRSNRTHQCPAWRESKNVGRKEHEMNCWDVFLELANGEGGCPCAVYSTEITSTIIQKCLDLGPKKEEKFEPYAAVWVRSDQSCELKCVIEEDGLGYYKVTEKIQGYNQEYSKLHPLTNPREALRILSELAAATANAEIEDWQQSLANEIIQRRIWSACCPVCGGTFEMEGETLDDHDHDCFNHRLYVAEEELAAATEKIAELQQIIESAQQIYRENLQHVVNGDLRWSQVLGVIIRSFPPSEPKEEANGTK